MTLKKPAKLIAIPGACAVAVALPTSLALPGSFGPEADSDPEAAQSAAGVVAQPEPEPELPVGNAENALTSEEGEQVVDGETQASTDDGSSRVVDMIVQLKDGTDTAAALASINSAVAAVYPDASAEVSREYTNAFTGFALSAPIGSMDAIRGVSGVQSAFLDRETQVSDDANGDSDDAGSGSATTASRSQHPDNLSAQIMMHADKVTQKGEGKVVAIIDTGVEMNHPAFSGALHGTPAIDSSKGASLAQQVGKSGTYVSEKFPFAYDYADGDNDASPAGAHGTHVAGITAANGDQIMGIAPDAQIIVAKVARSRGGGIPDSALLAALDDMATLHPDAVNMSLGRTAGMDSDADTLFAGVYEKLQEKGITLDVAGGNEFQAGYGNKSGKNLPYASDPDSSTLGEPGSFAPVVTVASIENARNGANGNYKMSDFSSWGVSPDMRLKPEVTAPGGNIYSSVPGGGYQMMSGTSMATPQMTGASAVVLERVQNDPLFSSLNDRQKVDVVQNLIMGTAVPVVDPGQGGGAYYSPRKQGAGLANLEGATNSSVYPTVNGAADSSRPKAELGDGTNGWHFDVTLHNVSDTPATYELSSQALSENIEGGFFTGHSTDWNGKGVSVSFSGSSVTVPAKGETTVGIDIKPGNEFAQYVSANAPAGTFLDGFVRFTSRTNGQPDLGVPFLGFYGSWAKPAIFDALVSEGDAHAASSGIYNGDRGGLLGYNPLLKGRERQGRPNAERYVVSRSTVSGAPTAISPRTGTLRSVHKMTTTYTNEAGKSVASFTSFQNFKSTIDPEEERMSWVEEGQEPRSIDLKEGKYASLPDGNYKLTIAANNDGPSSTEQSITYNFRIDTKAPVVDSAKVNGSTLSVELSDESPLAGFTLNDPNSGRYIHLEVARDENSQTYENGRYHYKTSIDLNQVQGGASNNPSVVAWDYGLNHSEPVTMNGGKPGNGGGQPGNGGGQPGVGDDQPGNGGGQPGDDWGDDQPGNGGGQPGDDWGNDQPGNGGGQPGDDWGNGGGQPGDDWGNGGGQPGNGGGQPGNGGGQPGDGWDNGGGQPGGGWDNGGGQPGGNPGNGGNSGYCDFLNGYWLSDPVGWWQKCVSGKSLPRNQWSNIGGKDYFVGPDGNAQTGWLNQGDTWYYLDPSNGGSMCTGTRNIDGKTYTFDNSGALVK